MTDHVMDAPKVREIVSSKPISAQAAHDLLSRFLETERQDIVAEAEGDELLVRLEHVCASIFVPHTEQTTNEKAKKKAAKKERKEKRKREKQSAKKNKKSKTTT